MNPSICDLEKLGFASFTPAYRAVAERIAASGDRGKKASQQCEILHGQYSWPIPDDFNLKKLNEETSLCPLEFSDSWRLMALAYLRNQQLKCLVLHLFVGDAFTNQLTQACVTLS